LPITGSLPALEGRTRSNAGTTRGLEDSRDLALLGRHFEPRDLSFVQLGERALVFVREDLDELGTRDRPVVEQLACALPALGERQGVLSSDGEAVLKTLTAKTEAVLAKFPG
jgi:hypothetical protein